MHTKKDGPSLRNLAIGLGGLVIASLLRLNNYVVPKAIAGAILVAAEWISGLTLMEWLAITAVFFLWRISRNVASAGQALRSKEDHSWTVADQLEDLAHRVGLIEAASDAAKIAEEKHAKWRAEFDAAVDKQKQNEAGAAFHGSSAPKKPEGSDQE